MSRQKNECIVNLECLAGGNVLLTTEGDFSPKLAAWCKKKRRLDDNVLDRKTQTIIGCQACYGAGIGYAIKN